MKEKQQGKNMKNRPRFFQSFLEFQTYKNKNYNFFLPKFETSHSHFIITLKLPQSSHANPKIKLTPSTNFQAPSSLDPFMSKNFPTDAPKCCAKCNQRIFNTL